VFTEVHTSWTASTRTPIWRTNGGSTRTSRGDTAASAWGRTKRTFGRASSRSRGRVRLVNKDGMSSGPPRGEPGREIPRRQRGRGGQDHGQAQGRFREGAEAEVISDGQATITTSCLRNRPGHGRVGVEAETSAAEPAAACRPRIATSGYLAAIGVPRTVRLSRRRSLIPPADLLPALGGVVGSHRLAFAEPFRRDRTPRHSC